MTGETYRRRSSSMSSGEREWRVTDDALVRLSPSGRVKKYAWRDIVSVRLFAAPARRRPWRYVFELQPRHARRIRIDNAHFAGSGEFEDRSADYTPFVRASLRQLAAANPKARALMGETPKRYFFLLLAGLFGLGGLALLLITAPTPLDRFAYAAPVKFGLILLMLPVLWLLAVRAMPRGVSLDDMPERALPPVQ